MWAAEPASTNKIQTPVAAISAESVQETFLKGKASYDAGDTETALRIWQGLDPYLAAYPSLRKVIDYLKARASAGSAATPAPLDVTTTLEKAAEQMQARRDEAQRAQETLSSGKRSDWIHQSFERGRSAADEGDWATAIAEWDKLASYLDESAPERATIESLKRDYFSSEKLRAETRRLLASSKDKLKAPKGLSDALEEAKNKLRSELAQASNQSAGAGKARSEREAWVDATLVRARAAYEEGRIEPAIAEWEKALPYLEGEEVLRQKLTSLRESLRTLGDARAQSDGASAEAFSRIKVPLGDRLSAEIARATDMLRTREGRAIEQQKDVEKSLAEREEWIAAQFEKGKQFLSAGRTADALDQWEAILPNVEGGDELRASFDRVRSQIKEADEVESRSKPGAGAKLKAPPELDLLMDKASKDLSEKRTEAQSRLKAVEAQSAKTQKEVAAAFERGKDFYVQGKYWEAAEAWKALLPLIEESPQLEKWIAQFESDYRGYLDSKNVVDQLSGDRARKYAAPADVLKLLMQAQKDVEARTAALVAERASMEKGAATHEAWAKEIFQKGKTLYQQGQIDLAIAEWEKLVPHLEETSSERALILDLKKQRSDTIASSERIRELTDSGKERIQAPSDLKLVLESAVDTLRAKQRESELEQQAVSRSIDERRNMMLQILQTGKNSFDEGNPAEAITEWKKLLQYVDARSKLDETLKAAEAAFNEQTKARKKLEETQARGGNRFEPPQELAASIQQAADRIAMTASQARTEKLTLDKDYSSRKLWLDQTYQAGKQLYVSGKLEEAVEEWVKLSPYLPEDTGISAKLTELKTAKDDSVRARKDAVEAVAQQYKGLRVDPQMQSFLADISKDLKTQAIQSDKDRKQAEGALATNQEKSETILKEGKVRYDAGDLQGALIIWAGLLPLMDEASVSYRTLSDLRKLQAVSVKAHEEMDASQKKIAAGIELPSDFAKLAEEAKSRLTAQKDASITEMNKAQLLRADREKKAAAVYEVAKTKLWAGDIAGAVAGWKEIAPSVAGAPALVQTLEADLAQVQKSKVEMTAASARSTEKLPPPADFAKETEAARQKLRAEIGSLLVQKTKFEGDRAARQQTLGQAFERGKALYWSGKVPEAIAEWNAVAATVSDEEAVKAFDELKKAYARLLEARTSADSTAATAVGKLPPPAELSKLLALAVEKIDAQTQAAQAEQLKMKEDLAARRARAEDAFQKGAKAANAQQFEDAVSQWRLLTPLVDAQTGIGPALDGLEKAIDQARAAREEADTFAANEFKDIRFAHSDEIKKLVDRAGTQLKSATADAQKRRVDMEKTFADRQAWVESTFQKGKVLFEQGRYVEAQEFWKSLAPYLVDGAQSLAIMADFERAQNEAAKAVADAAAAEKQKDTKFAAPAELPNLLAAASEKMKAAQFDARTRRERVEQALSDRRVAIQTAFDKGKASYEKGSVPSALEEWEKMLPMVEDQAKVKEALDAVRIGYQQSVQARTDATAAEAKKDAALPVPVELSSTLSAVSERMKKEVQSADALREKMDKALADRKAYVRTIFDRGKALYAEGKLREAFDLWKTIGPYTEDEEKLDELLSKAGQAYEGFVAAKSASHEATLKQSTKLPTPPELAALLEESIAKTKQDDFDSRNQTFEIEKSIADRRLWIQSSFKKGQALYIEGRYPEAVAEWNTILPYLQDGLEVKAKLVDIEKSAALAEKSRAILAQSQEKLKLQFHSPAELSELLIKANEDLKNQMFSASAEKMKAEQTLGERQKWMNQTFDLARSFYAEGKVGEALAEWSKLKPYLDGQPAIEEMMKTLQTSYDALQKTKKDAVEATAEDYKGLQLAYTDQMAKVLEGAVKKVSDETLSLREKLEKTHETLAERKEWSVTTFNKGKVLYEDDRYKEALEQWQRLLPYLEKDAEVKVLIESFQKSLAEWSDRSGAVEELAQRVEKPVALAQPETMAVTLKDAADKMKAQAEAATAHAADLEKQLSGRKEWIEFTFQKGKKLFDAGNYADAVNEWGVLGPYLSEHPDVRAQIEEAKRSYIQFRKADQILQNAETKKAALPALPENAVVPPPTAAPVVEPAPVATPEAAPEQAPADAPVTATPAATLVKEAKEVKETTTPASELISGEVLSVDRGTSMFYLKLFVDASEISMRFDGATQFDGADGVSADSLQKGASVDVRTDSENRATYVYIY